MPPKGVKLKSRGPRPEAKLGAKALRFASLRLGLAWLGLGIVCVLWPARKRRIDTRTAAATAAAAAADCAQIRQANKPVAVAQGCRQFGCLVGSPFAHMQHTRAAAAAEAAATIAF